MKRTLLLTCAGRSTRFPNHRAKWSLTHPSGHTMAAMALRGLNLDPETRVVVAFNQHDFDHYGFRPLQQEFLVSGFVVNPVSVGETRHQVETVLKAMDVGRISDDDALTVRDCDNFFRWNVGGSNQVAVVDLNDVEVPLVVRNKSYATLKGDHVERLDEKKVTSPYFCCGAYSFVRAGMVPRYAKSSEFLSGVVTNAVDGGAVFGVQVADDYEDWGTEEDWLNYTRQWRTLFVDIDGVLVKSSHRTFSPVWGESEVIDANVAALNRLHATGKVEIILTTSRPDSLRQETILQLKDLKFDRLIMGLRNCARVLVNDSVGKRRQLTALAINIERESPQLGELLGAL
jgi:hypothetical protein